MERLAVFPGSFDPLTRGHESVVLRALELFDKIIIGIGCNTEKKYLFPLEKRVEWVSEVFKAYKNIEVASYSGLTVEFCRQQHARFILRGLRTSADFEFERSVGQINKQIYNEIETVFFLALPEYNALSSSVVRDVYIHGGDISSFVPNKMLLPPIK